jgi:RNA polymerase sigma-70 factor, ECF subfamily
MSVLPFPNVASSPAVATPTGARPEQAVARDDEDLARRVAQGDRAAVEALLHRYWQPLIRYASRVLDDEAGAEDVVQDAFLRVWTRRAEAITTPVRAYLYRVTRNLAIDELRRRNARTRRHLLHGHFEVAPAATPAEVLQNERLRARVNAAIQALPERRREAFTLVYLRGLSYTEVSEIMGISPKTLGNHISAALAELRVTLRPLVGKAGHA